MTKPSGAPDKNTRPRLFSYSLSFIFNRHLHKILKAHDWRIKIGLPLAKGDAVAVWGRTKTTKRGMAVASYFKKPVVTFEDAFLRSVLTGRQGAQSLGLVVDQSGIYFDTSQPSDLDKLLQDAVGVNGAGLKQATDLMHYMCALNLSKYNNSLPPVTDIPDDFVLVIDQTYEDAAITKGAANAETFATMLACAKAENPDKKILIKTHPETMTGNRQGYFSMRDCNRQTALISSQVAPMTLFEKAAKVYCVTSQMGMEAIFAGHKPIVFGRPFYAGLGLSDDRVEMQGKDITLSAAQLFWATHLQYSKWYDPYFERATDFQTIAGILHTQARQNQDNNTPAVCVGMRLWKRGFMRKFLSGQNGVPQFIGDYADAAEVANIKDGRVLVWAGRETEKLATSCAHLDVPLIRVEDGFLRSVGLGAQLVAPVSLAFDNAGIYYDPTRPSQLEQIINATDGLSEIDLARARDVQERIIALKMTKYNLTSPPAKLSAKQSQKVILVPGQVEDDASIIKGAGQVATNLELLKTTRKDFPDAYIVFKPHPDVEAGLRTGAIDTNAALKYADKVAANGNMADLLAQVDRVATITSLAGFEALLRGKPVTCYGTPFYAGWGLTEDKADKMKRRKARPKIEALIHACLIDYPRYWDPVTHVPCPIEVVLGRFERGEMQAKGGSSVRLLAKLQGVFASYAHLWR